MIFELNDAISKVAPIDGVRIGNKDDRNTWAIYFKPEATKEQREAAESALRSFSPSAKRPDPLTADVLAKILITKGVLSADDLNRKG